MGQEYALSASPTQVWNAPLMGSKRKFAAASTNVGIWHKTDVQPLAILGPLTGAKPTFGAECRFTDTYPT